MSNFNQESVLSVQHWTDTLFSFGHHAQSVVPFS
jgi:hypothetical protein